MKAKQLHNETLSKIKGGHIGMTDQQTIEYSRPKVKCQVFFLEENNDLRLERNSEYTHRNC